MMTSEFSSFDAAIVEIVKRQLDDTDPEPTLLSKLGVDIQRMGISIPKSMARHIESNLGNSLAIIRHPEIRAYVAVCPVELKEVIAGKILQKKPTRVFEGRLLDRLPRSLLVAFCKELPEEENVFFSKTKPFHYVVSSGPPDETLILIDKEFRIPGTWADPIKMPPAAKAKLLQNLELWSVRYGLALESFTIRQAELPNTTNALERFLRGVPDDVRAKLSIPADIVDLLLRSP